MISPFFIMILLIRVISLWFWIRLASSFSILLILSKNKLLVLLICYTVLLTSISLSSAQIFINSLLLLGVGSICCFFSSSFRCKVSMCIWIFSNFFEGCLYCKVFPFGTAFAVSQRFWTVVSSFSLVSMNLFNSSLISWLTYSSFSRMLFNLHMFEFLPNFFLWFNSSFKTLWSEDMQGTIPIFWFWLRSDL